MAAARLALPALAVVVLAGGAAVNPIPGENALGGADPATWLPPAYPPTSVEGYASETSVLPGGQAHLHVSTKDGHR